MADCVSKVELSVSCTDLLDKDFISKSDPLCVLLQSSGKDSWTELARTELWKNSLSPSFSQRLRVDYHFESVQNLKLEVYDIDNKSSDLGDDHYLGGVELTLGQIVASKTFTRPLQLKTGKPAGKGSITITAEEIKDNRDIQLEFEAKNLDDKDWLGKSDLFLEFFKQGDDGKWQLVHRTEEVKNNLSPTWKKFSVPLQTFCSSDLDRPLKVNCSDYDSDGTHDLIGSFTTKVSELQKAGSGSPVTFDCIHPEKQKKKSYKNSGVVSVKSCKITPEEIKDNRDIQLEFEAKNLDNKDKSGKSDPFLEFFKQGDDGKWQLVHITEVVKNNVSPTWKKFSVPLQTFCSSDLDRPLKVDCSDHDSNGTHVLIGSFTTKVSELQKAGSGSPVTFHCIHPKTQKKNSGVVSAKSCKLWTQYSFLDYVMDGCQINFTVGIDFTGSNGDPNLPNSLHYMSPDGLNQYLSALQSVGHVVQHYNTDKLIPAFGFGATLPPDHQAANHEFALNFNPTNPSCKGIEGIIEAYRMAMPQLRLSGPTNFSPIINHVSSTLTEQIDASQYSVLLILTDGEISDLDQTRDAIVRASQLPLSIIIVGVGPADFKAMELLDGDDGVLRSSVGEAVARDIVQFIPYRQFKDAPQASLAKSVLAEVPNQLVSYFKMRSLEPPKP